VVNFKTAVAIMMGMGLTPASGAAEATSLASVLEQVLDRNPQIKAGKEHQKSLEASVASAYTPPSPKIGLDYWRIPPGGSFSNAAMKMTMIQQEIPFPMALIARGAQARHTAYGAALEQNALEEKILAEAVSAYYRIWALQEEVRILDDHLALWRGMLRALESGLRSGTVESQDVFRSRAQMAKSQSLRDNAQATLESKRKHLSLLQAHTGENTEILALSPEAWQESMKASDLEGEVLHYNPELMAMEHHVIHKKLAVNEKTWGFFPDVTLGLTRMDETLLGPSTNIRIMATVPLNFWKPLSERTTAVKEARHMEFLYKSLKLRLMQKLDEHITNMGNAWRMTRTYNQDILPAERQATKISEKNYRAGRRTFLDFLDTRRNLLMEELQAVRSRAAFGEARGQVERILGRLARPSRSHPKPHRLEKGRKKS